MNKKEALTFLRTHQPMPDTLDDSNDWKDLVDKWVKAEFYFYDHSSVEVLNLFLGSFGGGDGGGAYYYFSEFIFRLYQKEPEAVEQIFIDALTTNSYSHAARVQVAKASVEVRATNPKFNETLLERVEDPNEDDEVRFACASAFSLNGFRGLFDVETYRDRIEAVVAKEREQKKAYDYFIYYWRPRDIVDAFDGYLLHPKERAFEFLRAHQPMPDTDDDDSGWEDVIMEWDAICSYFIEHPCLDAIPLFIGSFGGGDGGEVYQGFDSLLRKFNPDVVAPYLTEALSSNASLPPRLQVAESLVISGDPQYVETLLSRIEDFDENKYVRRRCAHIFSLIGRKRLFDVEVIGKRIEALLDKEADKDVYTSLRILLGDDEELTKESALSFLRSHQPMPIDKNFNLLRQWKRVCEYFRFNPDIEAIPLLIGSFGEEFVEEYNEFNYAVGRQKSEKVVPILVETLSSSNSPLARRLVANACQYVQSKDPVVYETLLSRFEDSNEDESVRDSCAWSFYSLARSKYFDIEKYRNRVEAVLANIANESGGKYARLTYQRLHDFLNEKKTN